MHASRASFKLLVALAGLLILPSGTLAQTVFESAGERALGMGGAFVAVADDATAAHWNPAGLATGGPAGMTIGWHRFRFGNPDATPASGAGRRQASFTSLGTWPLGVSYGTFQESWLTGGPDETIEAHTLRVSQFGVSVLQTVFPGLVVGSTVKFLRGGAVSEIAIGDTVDGALDLVEDRKTDRHNTVDLDVALMASSDVIRVGLTLKNLRSSSFGEIPGNRATLPRQARVGVAIMPLDGVTLAMDFDLDTVDLVGGLRRMGAVGGEAMLGSRVGIRSGVRWSLVGRRRPVGSVGLSVAVRQGMWLDGHYAQRQQDEEREFGVALRAGF